MRLIDEQPTIEPDWTELMVICDNCGHAIHVKRTDAKPTIEERKKGKWLETDSHEPRWNKCDQCGRLHNFLDNYCPNCGSYNGGENEA